jgi:PKD repeat protein
VVSLIATDTGGYASAPDTAAVIVAPAPPPPPTPQTMEKRVTAGGDDAEESATGGVAISSSDLELVFDGNNQTVGMRWTALPIPPGATVTNAWIQFAAKESHTEVTPLTLRGQAADNPAAFTATSGNLSTRLKTGASVSWSPASWTAGQTGAAQRTPDLTAVIQEIVSRPGWASGNALAMIITGTGHRTAWAYEGNAALAPLLHVEFTGVASEPPPVAQLTATQVASPPLTVSANGSGSTDTGSMPIASYRFNFGDGTPQVTTTAPTATAQHTYASPGTYTVTLIVTDTGGYASAPVTTTVTVTTSSGPQIAVYTGYYDTHHPGLTKPKPNPWRGSANTVFVGTPDSPTNNEWDSACIRIVNQGSTTLSGVVVTAQVGSKNFALWGTNSIAPGQNLVLAQTGFENFDGSDLNDAGCYDCNPNDCLTKVSSIIPLVRVTINGTTTTYYDSGQQLNTNGVDAAGCPYTGERNDESEQWEQITTQAPANYAAQQGEAGEVSSLQPIARSLWLGSPYPNPCGDRVVLRFGLKSMGLVRLGLYDVAGRLVRRSVDSVLDADDYQHMMKLDGIPSGAYYCRLDTPDGVLQRTIMVVR